MELKLPALEKIVWEKVGNKNIIRQLLARETEVDFEYISSNRGYSIISSNGIQYCLATKSEYAPGNFQYVLKTDKKRQKKDLETMR